MNIPATSYLPPEFVVLFSENGFYLSMFSLSIASLEKQKFCFHDKSRSEKWPRRIGCQNDFWRRYENFRFCKFF